MTKKNNLISEEMTMHEILSNFPFCSMVFEEYHLHCANCHMGAVETLKQGASKHGINGESLNNLLSDLEIAAQKSKKYFSKKKSFKK